MARIPPRRGADENSRSDVARSQNRKQIRQLDRNCVIGGITVTLGQPAPAVVEGEQAMWGIGIG
jgi:hypothetical protein